MRIALRYFVVDRQGALYRLPCATLDRMMQSRNSLRVPYLAGQRVRSAEVAVELLNGRPIRVVRSVFNILTFKEDGALVPPQLDRHTQAQMEVALAAATSRGEIVRSTTRFVARGGQWKPSAALVDRIGQVALGRQKCPRLAPHLW